MSKSIKKSQLNSGINGMAWMGLMTIVGYVLQLLVTGVLARLLTANDFGEIAAINIFIGLADLLWMMGVGPAVVQKKELSETDISTAYWMNIFLGFLIYFLIILFSKPLVIIFNIENIKILKVFSVIFLFNSFSTVSQSISQRKLKFKRISTIKILESIVYGVISICLAVSGLGVWSIVIATICKTICKCCLFILFEPIKGKKTFQISAAKELMFFGGGFTLGRILNYCALNIDNYLVGKLLGKGSNGLGSYSKSYQLLSYPASLVGDTIDNVMFPMLSQRQNDKNAFSRFFLYANSITALITIPISIICFYKADEIIKIALGNQWGNVVIPFQIMVLGLYFKTAYKLGDVVMKSIGMVYKRALIQFIYILFIAIGAILGSKMGLSGIAFSTTIAFTINYCVITMYCMNLLDIKIGVFLENIYPSLLIAIPTIGVLTMYTKFIVIENILLDLICFSSITFLCFGILFLMLKNRIYNDQYVIFINNIFNQIAKKFKLNRVINIRLKLTK